MCHCAHRVSLLLDDLGDLPRLILSLPIPGIGQSDPAEEPLTKAANEPQIAELHLPLARSASTGPVRWARHSAEFLQVDGEPQTGPTRWARHSGVLQVDGEPGQPDQFTGLVIRRSSSKLMESLNRTSSLGSSFSKSSKLMESLNRTSSLGSSFGGSSKLMESLNRTNSLGSFATLSRLTQDFSQASSLMPALRHSATLALIARDHSMAAFSRLARLSDAVHSAQPYARRINELLIGELGAGAAPELPESPLIRDAAALDAGLAHDLIAFPAAAYSEVVFAAGFKFRLPSVPVPQVLEAVDPGATFDPMHGTVLVQIEQRLRRLIEDRLGGLAGPRWIKQRVSEAVRTRWRDRQEEELEAGRPVYPLVQYSDFMDLADVIGQANNWREAFEPIFRSRDDFLVSLRRLHPVRKAIAHGRPLGRADVLTLVSEVTRICRALGLELLA